MMGSKTFCIFLVALYCLNAPSVSAVGFDCLRVIDDLVFDLTPLKISSHSDTPYTVDFGDSTLYFNMCQNLHKDTCSNDESMATVTFTDGSCDTVAEVKNIGKDSHWSTSNHDGDRTITLDYHSSQECKADNSKNYKFDITLACDSDEDDDIVTSRSSLDDSECSYSVYMKTKHACPKYNFSKLMKWFHERYITFGVLLILVGLFVNFFGRKMFKPTFVIIIVVFVTAIVLVATYEFGHVGAQWGWWIVLGVGIVLGLIIACICLCLKNLALFCVGAAAGCALALVLQNLFLYKIHSHPDNLSLYIVMGLLGLTAGVLMIKMRDHMLIIATSVLGSYAIVRGIALFDLQAFPSEWTVSRQIKSGTLHGMPWEFYLYFGGMVVVFILGLVVQYHTLRKEKEDEAADKYREVREADVSMV